MSGPHITLSSESMDWQTPEWFLDLVRRVGPIELDPCTTLDNPTGARLFYTQRPYWLGGDCGLSRPWWVDGLVYINSPYGKHLSGPVCPDKLILKKGAIVGRGAGWAARIARHEGEALALLPTRTDTAWFRLLHQWCDWRLDWSSPEHGSRIHFVDPFSGQVVKGSNLPSTVFYKGPRMDAFCDVFEPHGTLVPGEHTLERLLALSLDQG